MFSLWPRTLMGGSFAKRWGAVRASGQWPFLCHRGPSLVFLLNSSWL